jgi:hypothetical protein
MRNIHHKLSPPGNNLTTRGHGRYCFAARRYFRTSAEFWLGLQSFYDLRLAEMTSLAVIERAVKPRKVA